MTYLTEEREIERGASNTPAPVTPSNRDDGTSQLLRAGAWTLVVGVISALLIEVAFGGITRQGPHTNSGWFALIVAMMCLPFGLMLFALGAAKWMRNRRLRREYESAAKRP
jgi:hypothetical protein